MSRQSLNITLRGAFHVFAVIASCGSAAGDDRPGTPLVRKGDEIVACGQYFHAMTPVVLWTDPGGYDAYRVELRFAPWKESTWPFSGTARDLKPIRFGIRQGGLAPGQFEKVRGGGWDLPALRKVVDQFVIHFDASGTSRSCFEILHDRRGLSVHFMLDLDGTIYQTLDLKESAWHATIANGRSIGIEIANVGAYPPNDQGRLAKWYRTDGSGRTQIVLPDAEEAHIRERPAELRPERDAPVVGQIQGRELTMYDLTPQQYRALARLTATLCSIFPGIRLDYPRDSAGKLITRKLPDAELANYRGILGHYHVQTNKVDPGPAFQWDKLLRETRQLREP